MLGGGLGVLVALICLLLAIKIRKKGTSEAGDLNPTSSSTTSSLGTPGLGLSVVDASENTDHEFDKRLLDSAMGRRAFTVDRTVVDSENLHLLAKTGGHHQKNSPETKSFMPNLSSDLQILSLSSKTGNIETIIDNPNNREIINEVVNINEEGGPDLIIDSIHINTNVSKLDNVIC